MQKHSIMKHPGLLFKPVPGTNVFRSLMIRLFSILCFFSCSKDRFNDMPNRYNAKDELEAKNATPVGLFCAMPEIGASYPGTSAAWTRFLLQSVHYPQEAIDKEIQGTVIVQFVIKENGDITDLKAVSGPELLINEALRVLKTSEKWVPATVNGKAVSSHKRQPIVFRLEEED
jgi:TonB family protein